MPSTVLTPPDGSGHGVQVEYFDNPELQGQPKLRRIEPRVYFDLGMEDSAIITAVGREKYSVRWTSTLTPTATGEYRLNIRRGSGPRPPRFECFWTARNWTLVYLLRVNRPPPSWRRALGGCHR